MGTKKYMPEDERRHAAGFFFATCPGCRIIYSMPDLRAKVRLEQVGCVACRECACSSSRSRAREQLGIRARQISFNLEER